MSASNFVIATAGHVDHGKSALVQALTGTDPDRLPEEKARGITIDLGFAELSLTGPSGDFHVSIIDVPGHENFVRNMIAGVGSIDLALLVVAVDDGWMPQTEEHLQILTYLGIERGVIAVTKADLGNVKEVITRIHKQLDGTAFSNVPIIPTSVRTGSGIEQLKTALTTELSRTTPARDVGKPRLFVDRAFSLRGVGTVVTGTLTGGTFHQGHSVIVQPRNIRARIRSIQHHGRESELARPATRTAINLPDLSIGTSSTGIRRGDVVVNTNEPEPTSTVDVLVEKSARLHHNEAAARPLRNGATIYFHHGTARIAGKIVFLDSDQLEPGQQKVAQVGLDSPVLAFIGDRFIIRDPSEQHTLAGGLVLDPKADRRSFRTAAQVKLLGARAVAPNDIDVCVSSEIERRGPIRLSTLLPGSRFSREEITAALERLRSRNEVTFCGEIAANSAQWQTLRHRAGALVDQMHTKNSERPGLDINELRALFHDQPNEVFEALVSDLCTNDFIRAGSIIARRSHRAVLPRHLKEIAERMMALLQEKGLNPPGRKELATDRDAQQTLAFLIEQGRIIEISPDIVLPRDDYVRITAAIVDYISRRGPATVSQLRQQVETSRRVIVPLLEKLDRDHVTRRVGDRRILAE